MTDLSIPVILGTPREGRQSAKAAEFVLTQAKNFGFKSELIDVFSFPAEQWPAKMAAADGLVVVAPEYNHGYPGPLKTFLDSTLKEYQRKPLAICGVSSSGLGGARMVEQLRLVAIELQMVPIRHAVYFAKVKTLFNEAGEITDPSYAERLKKMFDELAWYATALKTARG